MSEREAGALMREEVGSIPRRVAAQLAVHGAEYSQMGQRWRAVEPRLYVTCARGTSDQAALFFKYLTEIGTGVPVASIGPSLGSLYPGALKLSGAAALAISQSGASPDLLALLRKCSEGGAETVALVNTTDSPLALAADHALPIGAGPEIAVAATKSLVCSLVALTAIHAAQTGNTALTEALPALPGQLDQALAIAPGALSPLGEARAVFALGRGPGLAIAGEVALKLKETCGIAVEGMSSAEFRHGPMTLAGDDMAAFMVMPQDISREGNEALAAALREKGAKVVTCGPGDCDISTPATGHAALDAIVIIAAFYRQVLEFSLSRGRNPDQPPHLVKATLTV